MTPQAKRLKDLLRSQGLDDPAQSLPTMKERNTMSKTNKPEFLEFAEAWHDGIGSSLYAFCSVGTMKHGTNRPIDPETNQPASDAEWSRQLWSGLAAELRYIRRIIERRAERPEDTDQDDLAVLVDFLEFAESQETEFERLRQTESPGDDPDTISACCV